MMIGTRVCFFQTIDSTNDYMKEHMSAHAHGDFVVARIQTAGRGRRDRKWVSRDGNLHATVLLDPSVQKWTGFDIVIRVSLAVVDALSTFGIEAMIKYPNDIVVNHHKIAGILIEQTNDMYVVGIGVNVTLDDVGTYAFHPSSILLETGRFVDYRDVLSAVIEAFNDLLKEPNVAIFERYKTLSAVMNHHISHEGVDRLIVDITTDGSLVLDTEQGDRIQPNEVTLSTWYDDK